MSRKKNYNNRRRKTKVKSKKKKLNKKRLVLLISIICLFIFGVNKAAIGVSQVAKNIDNIKREKIEEEKENELKNEKQFNLEEEQTDALDKKYTVLIDPGHGGKDPGNLGFTSKQPGSTEKIYEKDLTLQVSKKVASILSKQNDVQVVITRADDKFLTPEERVSIANSQNIDALVSIHMNAEAGGSSAYGLETYYRPKVDNNDKSQHFAKIVQDTIGSYIKVRDRGIKEDIFQVLRDTHKPAILVECGFITNQKEEQKLIDEKYQDQLAEGIAQGVLSFLDTNVKK